MAKRDFWDRFFVCSFSAGISLFIIFGAYWRRGIKPLLLICFIALIFMRFREKRITGSAFLKRYFASAYIPFIFFGMSVILATIFSKDVKHSTQFFIERYFLYFLVFEIGRRFFTTETVSRIYDEAFGINIGEFTKYIFIFAGLFMGLGGVVDYIRFHPDRLFTVFGHEIQFLMLPLYITYFLPVIYCFIFTGNTRTQRFLSLITVTLLVMCMIFTGSKAVWLVGVAGMIFASFLINKKHLKYFIPGFLIYLAVIYFLMPIRMSYFGTYFPRKDIMEAAVGIFRDNALFGAGPGMYEKLVPLYSKGYVFLHAHNTYLEILAELGLTGLITFLAIFICFYARVIKNLATLKRSADKFLFTGLLASNAACLAFALLGSIILVGFHDAPVFWLIFGLNFGLFQRLTCKNLILERAIHG